MNKEEDNLEQGRQEIWRRHKIFLAAFFLLCGSGPFSLIIADFIGTWFYGATVAIAAAAFVAAGVWYQHTPCPNCGAPILGWRRPRSRCRTCEFKFYPPKKPDHLISLTPINYKPGSMKNVEQEVGQVSSESALSDEPST